MQTVTPALDFSAASYLNTLDSLFLKGGQVSSLWFCDYWINVSIILNIGAGT